MQQEYVIVQLVLQDVFVKQRLVRFGFLSVFILEIVFQGLTNCQNVVCANGGVCNSIPSTENGVEVQCSCLTGRNISSNLEKHQYIS